MEYKHLQAELDDINQGLADTDKELDYLQEGSPQFMVCTSKLKQLNWLMTTLFDRLNNNN